LCISRGADGGGTPLPWHQDGGEHWALDRDPLMFVWIALTQVRAGVCFSRLCCRSFPPKLAHLWAQATRANGAVQVILDCFVRRLTLSNLTPHTSHVTPHTSHLTPHTSHLTPHTSVRWSKGRTSLVCCRAGATLSAPRTLSVWWAEARWWMLSYSRATVSFATIGRFIAGDV
jgi:hypothetical protein